MFLCSGRSLTVAVPGRALGTATVRERPTDPPHARPETKLAKRVLILPASQDAVHGNRRQRLLLRRNCSSLPAAKERGIIYGTVHGTLTREKTMDIKRNGSQPSGKGPASISPHGSYRPAVQPARPARVFGASVTFEPGARTAWHTHPLGQTLVVTAGCAGHSGGAGRWKKSGRVTRSGFRPVKSTGMAPRPPRQ